MTFDHENLDVYRVALAFVAWAHGICGRLKGLHRHSRDELLRASQSVVRNIAEGNGKWSPPDRRRYLEIARGSAQECAATVDILTVCGAISELEANTGKDLLHRIVSMLTKMVARLPEAVQMPSQGDTSSTGGVATEDGE